MKGHYDLSKIPSPLNSILSRLWHDDKSNHAQVQSFNFNILQLRKSPKRHLVEVWFLYIGLSFPDCDMMKGPTIHKYSPATLISSAAHVHEEHSIEARFFSP